MLKGKKIVLGITGSIAAYKSCLIIRELIKRGAEVQVVITDAGKEFITPVTLSALTQKPVITDFFSSKDGSWHSHVDLGIWADAMLIAPCTANTLAKMSNGIADNMLLTTYLSMKAPVFVAPAMDLDMFSHPTTQANICKLSAVGNQIIEPTAGFLASGLSGKGRMDEPEHIIEALDKYFEERNSSSDAVCKDLAGKKVLITAGPTYERIDPVRFVGNFSSGKMGYALAEECVSRGADVVLVSGPVALGSSPAIRRINVESSDEMLQVCLAEFENADITILCAAVADFKPTIVAPRKIKKQNNEDLSLSLVPTADIAFALGQRKAASQILIGFALETDNEENNALAKLEEKNFDFIVLNSLKNANTCFQADTNQIKILTKSTVKSFDLKPKREVAKDIMNEVQTVIQYPDS